MTDSHAHLDACAEPDAVVARALDAGVSRIVTIGTGIESCRRALEIAGAHAVVVAALGIDPHRAATDDASRIAELRPLLEHPAVREAVWALGHDIVIDEANTMDERLAAALRTERDSALLFGFLGAIGLVVAVAGVYGVVAYSVSQRKREIGIRIALGARHRQVVGEFVRESAWPVAVGIAMGLPGAVVTTRAVASVLFEIQPTDARTYVATAVVLSLTALAASWIPARHAARVDPITALRAE